MIYHSLMTDEQAARLERLQARTLRIIYGHQKSYAEILEDSGIERLSERRLRIIDRFIVKCAESDRFGERWFPKKEFTHMDLRRELVYVEKYAPLQLTIILLQKAAKWDTPV